MTTDRPEPEYDAETVEQRDDKLGVPVDPPDVHRTLYATVVARRDVARRPIVPASLRSKDQRRLLRRWALRYGGHTLTYHVTRTPKYAAKMLAYAPVGAGRVVWRTWRWAYDLEQWSARQQAANRNDVDAYMKLMREADQHRRVRVPVVILAAAVAVAVAAVVATLAPIWVRVAVAIVTLAVLARVGRPVDKPITDRVEVGERFIKLTGEQVRAAVVALGVGVKDPAAVKFQTPIYRDGPGWMARFDLPPGVEAVKVLERRGSLSSALRLPVDQVWPSQGLSHAGQVDLWVGFQPASKMGQPRWSLASPSARTSVFEPVEFGTDQRHRPVTTTLFERNFLIGGVPGSGKSYAARTLAIAAALDPTCELKIAEFKGTADFGDLAPLCSTYVCGVDDTAMHDGAAIIAWGLAEARRRSKLIKAARERGEAPLGKVTPQLAASPGSGLHPVVIIIDEAHELLDDKQTADAAERLIKQGRALGVVVVLATQVPDRDSVPPNITRCVTVRWCLAVQDQVANDMILGTGSYKRGLSATVYRPGLDAGWGIVTGLAEPTSVRSHFPDPQTTKAIIARATMLRGGVVGDSDTTVAPRDVLADILRVFSYTGRPGLQWVQLAELLAVHMPEAYAGINQESVSALVRGLGVPTENVKVDNVVLKGCKRAEIEAAIRRREITDR